MYVELPYTLKIISSNFIFEETSSAWVKNDRTEDIVPVSQHKQHIYSLIYSFSYTFLFDSL